jgi:predicted nucleic acid-binding protein
LSGFLVDTNLLVYAYDSTEGEKRRRAIGVLRTLGSSTQGSVSTQILGEFFNTVTRRIPDPLSADDAERSVAEYVASWLVHVITPAVVLEAIRGAQRFHLAYWDALIWATAKLNQIPAVLSEDFQDGAILENVRFINPLSSEFDLALLES